MNVISAKVLPNVDESIDSSTGKSIRLTGNQVATQSKE